MSGTRLIQLAATSDAINRRQRRKLSPCPVHHCAIPQTPLPKHGCRHLWQTRAAVAPSSSLPPPGSGFPAQRSWSLWERSPLSEQGSEHSRQRSGFPEEGSGNLGQRSAKPPQGSSFLKQWSDHLQHGSGFPEQRSENLRPGSGRPKQRSEPSEQGSGLLNQRNCPKTDQNHPESPVGTRIFTLSTPPCPPATMTRSERILIGKSGTQEQPGSLFPEFLISKFPMAARWCVRHFHPFRFCI